MPDFIPIAPDDNNGRLRVPLDNETYLFDLRWNSRDAAYYIDIREQDETPVALGLKLVLGVNVGRTSTHPFFQKHLLRMIDSSDTGLDAAFDDIGNRVFFMHVSMSEIVGLDGGGV